MIARPFRFRLVPLALVALLSVAGLFALGACGGDDDDGGDAPTPTVGLGNPDDLRQAVHWHADFLLVINGERFDFEQEQFVSEEDELLDDYLHIHPNRFTVVHVHREQSTWREFFGTFGWTFSDTYLEMEDGTRIENDDTNTWKFFVNEVRVDSIQLEFISDLQRVLIVYGPETPEEALEMYWPDVTNQACIVSGLCADRVDPNEPPEQCAGRGTCT